MIDLQNGNDEILSLAEAAKWLPGQPHISTLARWTRGMKDGRRLETVKIGGRVYTDLASLKQFVASARGSTASVSSDAISASRRNKLAQIDRQLEGEGL